MWIVATVFFVIKIMAGPTGWNFAKVRSKCNVLVGGFVVIAHLVLMIAAPTMDMFIILTLMVTLAVVFSTTVLSTKLCKTVGGFAGRVS